MKRLFSLVVAICAVALSTNAQQNDLPENEISISVGAVTNPDVAIGLSEVFTHIIGDDSEESSAGAYSLMYLHNMNKHVAIGVSATYEQLYEKSKYITFRDHFISVMPTGRLHWFRGSIIGMYSRIGAGVSCVFYKDSKENSTEEKNYCDTFFAFQVSPVCLEIGSKNIGAFVELGYGFQGVVNAGIKIGF